MDFLQHILEIDERIERRNEEEYQNSLFGIEDGVAAEGALAMSHTVTNTWRIPGGGSTRVTHGRITSTSQRVPGVGTVRTSY